MLSVLNLTMPIAAQVSSPPCNNTGTAGVRSRATTTSTASGQVARVKEPDRFTDRKKLCTIAARYRAECIPASASAPAARPNHRAFCCAQSASALGKCVRTLPSLISSTMSANSHSRTTATPTPTPVPSTKMAEGELMSSE